MIEWLKNDGMPSERLLNDRITSEWQIDLRLLKKTLKWRNDFIMMRWGWEVFLLEWHENDGIKPKWLLNENDGVKSRRHLSNEMTLEWWDDFWMTEVKMTSGWWNGMIKDKRRKNMIKDQN